MASTNRRMNKVCNCNKTLIIDDNYYNILAIKFIMSRLKNLPQGIDMAQDGLKGFDAIKKKLTVCCGQPYLLVIVDLNMPNLDGIGMMKKIMD